MEFHPRACSLTTDFDFEIGTKLLDKLSESSPMAPWIMDEQQPTGMYLDLKNLFQRYVKFVPGIVLAEARVVTGLNISRESCSAPDELKIES